MESKTETPQVGDRRSSDRRTEPSADFAGPERRVSDRRSGGDRRKSPRFKA